MGLFQRRLSFEPRWERRGLCTKAASSELSLSKPVQDGRVLDWSPFHLPNCAATSVGPSRLEGLGSGMVGAATLQGWGCH